MSDPHEPPVPHRNGEDPPPPQGPGQLEAFRSICSELSGLVCSIDRDLSETVAIRESLKTRLSAVEADVVLRKRLYESCLSIGDEFKKVEDRLARQDERIQSLLSCEKSVEARQSFIDERKKIFDY